MFNYELIVIKNILVHKLKNTKFWTIFERTRELNK